MKPIDFSQLFPEAKGWIDGLNHWGPFAVLDKIDGPFSVSIFGAFHLVGLALLGGASLLLNLRVLGAGVTDASMPATEKGIRPWLITGFLVVFITGLIMGGVNAGKLYSSPAFFVKMEAMVAGLLITFGTSSSIARADGRVTVTAAFLGGVGFFLYALSMFGFALTVGLNPGTFHILVAGYAILTIISKRLRWIGLGVLGLLCLGDALMYFVVGFDNQDPIFMDISRYAMWVVALALVGLLVFECYTRKTEPASPFARLMAVCAILTWVTAAAAGRWIGLS
jgi:hypothetical protein